MVRGAFLERNRGEKYADRRVVRGARNDRTDDDLFPRERRRFGAVKILLPQP